MKISTAYVSAFTLGFIASFAAGQDNESGWKPVDPPMLTRWAKDIDPKAPLPEYPRPQMTRAQWQSLNGLWQYAVTDKGAAANGPANWGGRILVPFPIESSLSGVKKKLLPDQTLWYQRMFDVPDDWNGKRVILHFGAVDYATEVFVNGASVGTHVGGYDPFSFDITDRLNGAGQQTLRVKVTDPTWTGGQPRGKQTLNPRGIMYTPTSGIWQTVWIEPVGQGGIEDLRIVPDLENKSVKVNVDLFGNAAGDVTISVAGGKTATGKAGQTIVVPVDEPRLWTPDNPHLYEMTVTAARDGKEIDKAGSYFGMRSIKVAEVDGVPRLLLNGKPIFMFGPLDQGFWPDGCYTAPTDEALRYDLEITRKLGFNTTRKHIKVEPADGWQNVNFNDGGWKTGPGGFGTRMTPNTGIVGTEWNTRQVWLRRTFNPGKLTEEQLKRLVLSIYHDEDATVYLNGHLIFEAKGFIANYAQAPLDERARSALKLDAPNVLAITCKQTTGGQYIDVGLSVKNRNR